MSDEANTQATPEPARRLDAGLAALDSALSEAARAVAAIRESIPEVAALSEVVRDMDAAMARARDRIGTPRPLRPASSEGETLPSLRLDVRSRTGSLDLKAVDGSVHESPGVADVALIDYDGREATFKLWLQPSADPESVREALTESLQRRLGEDHDADVRIETDEEFAA